MEDNQKLNAPFMGVVIYRLPELMRDRAE